MSSVATRAQSKCALTGVSLLPEYTTTLNDRPYLAHLIQEWRTSATGSREVLPDGTLIPGTDCPAIESNFKTKQLRFIVEQLDSLVLTTLAGLVDERNMAKLFLYAKALLMWAITLDARATLEQCVRCMNTLADSGESPAGLEALLILFQCTLSEMLKTPSQARLLQTLDEQRPTILGRGSMIDTAILAALSGGLYSDSVFSALLGVPPGSILSAGAVGGTPSAPTNSDSNSV